MHTLTDFVLNALSIVLLEKCFFKQVRILPEINWYNYHSAYPAPTLHGPAPNIDKGPYKQS